MVALKHAANPVEALNEVVKQERRGGIETELEALIPLERDRRSRNAVVALKHL